MESFPCPKCNQPMPKPPLKEVGLWFRCPACSAKFRFNGTRGELHEAAIPPLKTIMPTMQFTAPERTIAPNSAPSSANSWLGSPGRPFSAGSKTTIAIVLLFGAFILGYLFGFQVAAVRLTGLRFRRQQAALFARRAAQSKAGAWTEATINPAQLGATLSPTIPSFGSSHKPPSISLDPQAAAVRQRIANEMIAEKNRALANERTEEMMQDAAERRYQEALDSPPDDTPQPTGMQSVIRNITESGEIPSIGSPPPPGTISPLRSPNTIVMRIGNRDDSPDPSPSTASSYSPDPPAPKLQRTFPPAPEPEPFIHVRQSQAILNRNVAASYGGRSFLSPAPLAPFRPFVHPSRK